MNHNDKILIYAYLCITMHYFTDNFPYNLIKSHILGYTDICYSVWYIVDTINFFIDLAFSFLLFHAINRHEYKAH